MSSIARQVKETILGKNKQMQQKFTDLDMQIQSMQIQLRDQNNNQGACQLRNSTPMQTDTNTNQQECSEIVSRNQTTIGIVDFNLPRINSNTEQSASTTTQSRVDNYVKLKPKNYAGNDDFEDFLMQF
ncbi:MAG: hypothetical protein AB2693_29535 [Candidatus Thiodiazotropha sp.]